jgi:hypothetical protein
VFIICEDHEMIDTLLKVFIDQKQRKTECSRKAKEHFLVM